MPDGFSRQPPLSVAQEALAGLTAARKTLPAKLFYDAEGCRLFGLITELPEYYLTRTEMGLLRGIAGAIADIGPTAGALAEYGASREDKAAILLRAFASGGKPFRAYVPIDVAADALSALAARMSVTHPKLKVQPMAADFLSALTLPREAANSQNFGFFPGSTIGNLEPQAAIAFLQQVRQTLGDAAQFLIGADLRKDPAILLPAYDDAAGVTAAFNRNVLMRLNREAGANFDRDAFAHRAIWNDKESRIEMHLESLRCQTVRVAGHEVDFVEGETIHTENSYKHSLEHFAAITKAGGWNTLRVWTDSQRLFSLHVLVAA